MQFTEIEAWKIKATYICFSNRKNHLTVSISNFGLDLNLNARSLFKESIKDFGFNYKFIKDIINQVRSEIDFDAITEYALFIIKNEGISYIAKYSEFFKEFLVHWKLMFTILK